MPNRSSYFNKLLHISCLPLLLLSFISTKAIANEAKRVYQQHCASCHGADRLGSLGPALLPENLKRLRKNKAAAVIANGRAATQMPSFSKKLSKAQIQSLVDLVYTPLANMPEWEIEQIKSTHIIHHKPGSLPDKPIYKADPLNLFIVVETGDHHATILDGDKLEPIHRFKTRFALHGGPKYSKDGRFVYFASRDGWISKFDMYNLKVVAEIRAGINTRNAAVSSDGRYVLVGNYLPHSLVVLDAEDLAPIKIIPVTDEKGNSSRVSAVYDARPRQSFIIALKDLPEVWEIPYGKNAEPIYPGLVHDYKLGEGLALKGRFPVRRIHLDDYLDDFFFDSSYQHLIGAARNGKNGQVVNMDVGRKIADIDLSGLPHLGSGITWEHKGQPILATPNLKNSEVSIINMKTWKTIKRIKTLGPGFFMRSHENSKYAWTDVFFGPNKDVMHVIDKNSLEIVKTFRPVPGKTAAHIEFDRYGRYAILSIWDVDGAIIIYDAATLKEVKRLPMNKPSGKYNVYNKTRLSSGTSH
ncbi:MAG: c-type cytochrome [Sulfuriflexus sp.]|nr:c-type cytochrome [Sulfuriflexus sp.]